MKSKEKNRQDRKILKSWDFFKFKTKHSVPAANKSDRLYIIKKLIDYKCDTKYTKEDRLFLWLTKDFEDYGIWEEIERFEKLEISSSREKSNHFRIMQDSLERVEIGKRKLLEEQFVLK